MKILNSTLLVLAHVLACGVCSAQISFSEPDSMVFPPLEDAASIFLDANGDGHLDILAVGEDPVTGNTSVLYFGDGTGNLTAAPAPGVAAFRVLDFALGDIDGDTDEDVIIVGQHSSSTGSALTGIYLNDGTGSFTAMSHSVAKVSRSSCALADVDGDTDLDLLVMGRDSANTTRITKLYTNDGSANFTEVMGTPFPGLEYGDIEFADVDGDLDPDVFLLGAHQNQDGLVQLFTNDGAGGYTLATGTPFPNAWEGGLSAADVDGDTDVDLLVSGADDNTGHITELYLNNGTGAFTVAGGTTFPGVHESSVDFADIDMDGDQDVFLAGNNDNGPAASYAIFYANNGSGSFTELSRLPGVHRAYSTHFGDLDEDGAPELLSAGRNAGDKDIINLYRNNGAGAFLEAGIPIHPVEQSFTQFADFDLDGDLDAITLGDNWLEFYANDGTGTLVPTDSSTIGSYSNTYVRGLGIGDVNGDTLPDIVLHANHNVHGSGTYCWLNTGNLEFALQWQDNNYEMEESFLALGDLDNDGDLDAALIGEEDSDGPVTYLLFNDGAGNFSAPGTPLPGYVESMVAFSDLDGDADLDLVVCGSNDDYEAELMVFLNDSTGNFVVDTSSALHQTDANICAIEDFTGDGNPDILIAGWDPDTYELTDTLFVNDGSGNFAPGANNPLPGFGWVSALRPADLDGDGDLDVVAAGQDAAYDVYSAVFENTGSGAFAHVSTQDVLGVNWPAVAVGDLDGDAKPDLYVCGENIDFRLDQALYINTSVAAPCTATADSLTVIACNSYTLPSGAATITTPGTQVVHDTIANACGADSVLTITLTINTYSATITEDTPISCNGLADAAASVAPTGGSAPYSYLWSHGPSTSTVASLAATTYSVTVTDSTGCTASDTITIAEPAVLTTTIGITHIDCSNAGAGGTLTAITAGGTAAYSYAWSDGAATAANAGLGVGQYTITVTDARGCVATAIDSLWYQCEQVMNQRPMDKQDTSVWLTWDTVCGASKYKVMWKQAGPGPWNIAYKHSNNGRYFLSGLSPATTYRWAIKADCGISGWGFTGIQQGFTMLSNPCIKPTGLNEAIVQGHQAKLTWVQAPNVHTYRIRYREAGTSPWTVIPKDSVWAHHWITGLSGSTTYEWQMRSVCEGGTASGTFWTALETFTTPTAKMGQQLAAPGHVQAEIKVFPNPSNGLFNLAIEGVDREAVLLTVMDLHGRVVYKKQLSEIPLSYRGSIELHHAASGMYVLRVATAAKVFTKRLTVN